MVVPSSGGHPAALAVPAAPKTLESPQPLSWVGMSSMGAGSMRSSCSRDLNIPSSGLAAGGPAHHPPHM